MIKNLKPFELISEYSDPNLTDILTQTKINELKTRHYHSYKVAISHSARWYFGELISFLPKSTPFPTND